MKNSIYALCIIIACALSIALGISSVRLQKQMDNEYPMGATITHLDYANDKVYVTRYSGYTYTFDGCEDWAEGDQVACIMDTNGTDDIADDTIKSVRYCRF